MEKGGCGHVVPKKGKKKQGKDELDRQKQAEKKKRRLEKALATSLAIRSELEKKKQKKIEEQQRLDEEGLAIAEAVALHVLIGEDTDESHRLMLNNNRMYNPWDQSSNLGLFMGYQGFGWSTDAYRCGSNWNEWEIEQSLPRAVHVRDRHSPFYEETCGLIAAQAVASLQIAEDPKDVPFSTGNGVKFCKEFETDFM